MERKKHLILVRGGGDIATGTIYKLCRSGYPVLVTEINKPSAIRRKVAFSEAVYHGKMQVEETTCFLVKHLTEAWEVMERGNPAVITDEDCRILEQVRPWAVVDGILAKRNLGTHRGMADKTIALGPGFCAGKDVDLVVETMRGHDLGRIIEKGYASPDTGLPGKIGGYEKERVIYAPAQGNLFVHCDIGDTVKRGQVIAEVEADLQKVPVIAEIAGIIRGILPHGYRVTKGFKTADIDPRAAELDNCYRISDKARCIAGAVLEGLLYLEKKQGR